MENDVVRTRHGGLKARCASTILPSRDDYFHFTFIWNVIFVFLYNFKRKKKYLLLNFSKNVSFVRVPHVIVHLEVNFSQTLKLNLFMDSKSFNVVVDILATASHCCADLFFSLLKMKMEEMIMTIFESKAKMPQWSIVSSCVILDLMCLCKHTQSNNDKALNYAEILVPSLRHQDARIKIIFLTVYANISI